MTGILTESAHDFQLFTYMPGKEFQKMLYCGQDAPEVEECKVPEEHLLPIKERSRLSELIGDGHEIFRYTHLIKEFREIRYEQTIRGVLYGGLVIHFTDRNPCFKKPREDFYAGTVLFTAEDSDHLGKTVQDLFRRIRS